MAWRPGFLMISRPPARCLQVELCHGGWVCLSGGWSQLYRTHTVSTHRQGYGKSSGTRTGDRVVLGWLAA